MITTYDYVEDPSSIPPSNLLKNMANNLIIFKLFISVGTNSLYLPDK